MIQIDLSETETRDRYITPALKKAGWDSAPYILRHEFPLSAGRIVAKNGTAKRDNLKKKFTDYMLRYGSSIPLAIVEAKKKSVSVGTGVQQAKEYALRLDVSMAYVSNGLEIIEIDMEKGTERRIDKFPSPESLWERQNEVKPLNKDTIKYLQEPAFSDGKRILRYYQELAINRVIEGISQGNKRVLLTMATGTGKTFVAFQICWKLWQSKWNSLGKPNRKPRILFLADRNILVDDPKDKDFTPFGDARHKITRGKVTQGREMYFALYQSLVGKDNYPPLYEQYRQDFFDLIIVDEAHRGSARDESSWRKVLEYFHPAYQLGLTATPRRDDNIDSYQYFGNPVYEYSLKQGIEDGYLAPYTVHRVITNYDRDGWRPTEGQTDRYGQEIPDREYTTIDFDQIVSITPRTQAIANHFTQFLRDNNLRFAKTIFFCVDQEHADEMRRALNNLNSDLTKQYSSYVARITSDEGDVGKSLLSNFQDPEKLQPALVTTSQLLTTGVDIPTCHNIVLVRPINSMTEFKQIIGRGTRVRDDYGKLFFNIFDYAGSATDRFHDPNFDGYPALIREIAIDEDGDVIDEEIITDHDPDAPDIEIEDATAEDRFIERRDKYFVDDVAVDVEITAHAIYEIDAGGNRLNIVRYQDYTASQVRTLYVAPDDLREQWSNTELRKILLEQLEEKNIDFKRLAEVTNQPEADHFDLLCHLAFDTPVLTRRERALKMKSEGQQFFEQYGDEAQQILNDLLDQYEEYGANEFDLSQVLKIEPFTKYGSVTEIASRFGDASKLLSAVNELQRLLYAA